MMTVAFKVDMKNALMLSPDRQLWRNVPHFSLNFCLGCLGAIWITSFVMAPPRTNQLRVRGSTGGSPVTFCTCFCRN